MQKFKPKPDEVPEVYLGYQITFGWLETGQPVYEAFNPATGTGFFRPFKTTLHEAIDFYSVTEKEVVKNEG